MVVSSFFRLLFAYSSCLKSCSPRLCLFCWFVLVILTEAAPMSAQCWGSCYDVVFFMVEFACLSTGYRQWCALSCVETLSSTGTIDLLNILSFPIFLSTDSVVFLFLPSFCNHMSLLLCVSLQLSCLCFFEVHMFYTDFIHAHRFSFSHYYNLCHHRPQAKCR